MSIVKTEAFVLKSFKYGESSKIVTLFTKDFGKFNAIVKGARNFKSKICGTLESMNYIVAVVYLKENRELQILSNAEYKKSFSNLFTDFNKLEAAFKIIEIMNKSLIEQQSNKLMFETLLETFEGLNNGSKNFFNYILYFQIRLADLLGLVPDFSDPETNYETFFKINEFYLTKPQISCLILVYESTIETVDSLDLDRTTLTKLINGYERFISLHTQGYNYYKSTKVFQELNYGI